MHPRTRKTFDKLDAVSWFASIGQPVDGPVTVVKSWADAMAHCNSQVYDDLLLEAANRYSEAVSKSNPARFAKWNEIICELKKTTIPLVDRKIALVLRDNKLPQVFEDTVNWDILHLGVEAEFADVYPPGFFASQSYWYLNGHFPCGWEGNFPEGKLIIY